MVLTLHRVGALHKMFQSYKYKYLNYDQKSQKHNYEISIIDEDFKETITVSAVAFVSIACAAATAIIKIYSKRNLNVSKNIVAYMKYFDKQYGSYYDINNQIHWYKKDVPKFDNYLPKIEKYLLLK